MDNWRIKKINTGTREVTVVNDKGGSIDLIIPADVLANRTHKEFIKNATDKHNVLSSNPTTQIHTEVQCVTKMHSWVLWTIALSLFAIVAKVIHGF